MTGIGARPATLLLAAAVLSGCGTSSDSPEPRTHVVRDARPGAVAGTAQEIQVPTGTITVTFGAASRSEGGAMAPEGWTYLPLSLEETARAGVPDVVTGLLDETSPAATLVVEAGGDVVDLGRAAVGSTASSLPVQPVLLQVREGDLADLRLSVTYDGLTQVVTPEGGPESSTGASTGASIGAELLYRPHRDDDLGCSEGWRVVGEPAWNAAVTCTGAVADYPYAPEAGWAPRASGGDAGATTWGLATVLTEVHRVDDDVPGIPICARPEPAGTRIRVVSDRAAEAPVSRVDLSPHLGTGVGFALPAAPGVDDDTWPILRLEVSVRCPAEVADAASRIVKLTRDIDLTPAGTDVPD